MTELVATELAMQQDGLREHSRIEGPDYSLYRHIYLNHILRDDGLTVDELPREQYSEIAEGHQSLD